MRDTAFLRGCACFTGTASTGICVLYVAVYGLILLGGLTNVISDFGF